MSEWANDNDTNNIKLVRITAQVISSFVENNEIKGSEVPNVLTCLYGSLRDATNAKLAKVRNRETLLASRRRAVPVGVSHSGDYLIWHVDGKIVCCRIANDVTKIRGQVKE